MRRLLLLLLVVLAGCGPSPASYEELRDTAYGLLRRGDLKGAWSRADEGLQRASVAPDAAWVRVFEVLAAEIQVSQRRTHEAIASADSALAAGGPFDAVRVRALMTRGFARCVSGEGAEAFGRGESDLDEAARAARALASDELDGEVALRHGTCRVLQNDHAGAELQFRRALAIARRRQLPLLEANATGSLGLVRIRSDRFDEATDWLERSLEIASAAGADTLLVKTLGNLGWCYFRLGDYERALPLLERAERLAGARHLAGDRLVALTNLGNVSYRRGDHAAAARHFGLALSLARELGNKADAAGILANLATVAVERREYDEAERVTLEALRLEDEVGNLRGRQRSLLTRGRIRAAIGRPDEAEAIYREVIASPQTEPELLWETRAAVAELYVGLGRRAEADIEFRRALALMDQFRARLQEAESSIAFFSSVRRFHDAYVEFLVDAGRSDEALLVADRTRARRLRETLGRESPVMANTSRDLRRLSTSSGAILLSYWTTPRRSFLWIISPGGVTLTMLPDAGTIQRHVEAHQGLLLRSRDPLGEQAPSSAWLYDTLVGPAAPLLPPGARVIVVLDGPLHELNFDTLLVGAPRPHYWIEDVTLSVAPALDLLDAAPRTRVAHRRLLVIGDPVEQVAEFPGLPRARQEVERISGLFEEGEKLVITQADAHPSAYRRADPQQFSYIHFAAHANANREVPLDSAVILSAREEAYKLYAREIVTLPLHAELVTLSACRTAGSRAYAGEGLVGLAWAFLAAGAENVVGGLWNVDDAATAEVMMHLYESLRRHLEPAEALREAKLSMLRSATAYRKPFYWAPFVVYTREAARPATLAPRREGP